MTPIEHIQLHKDEFTKSELIIMDYVLSNLDDISSYPIATIADKCKVSKSALLRFCQKCGFSGYSEFKYDVSRYLQSIVQLSEDDITKTQTVIDLYTEQINQLPKKLDSKSLDSFSQLLINAKKIKIFGVHETALSAQYFCFRLASLGIDSEAVISPGIFDEKATMSDHKDLNIFLSLSAETNAIVEAIKCSSMSCCKTVLITQNDHHRFKNKTVLNFILPSFQLDKKYIFVDSQALVFITIDLFIRNMASHLRTK